MGQFIDRTGEVYSFSDGQTMEIIEYFNAKNITIKFNDGTIMKNVKYYRFTDGLIKNSNHPFVHGVGYIGYGLSRSEIKGNLNIVYSKWSKMLQRCYSEIYQKRKPTYIGCTVHPHWHNFQNFAKWCEENYIDGFELDKDILIKGNKIYSAETCCFVPRKINSLFIKSSLLNRSLPLGVYEYKNKYRSYVNIDNKLKLVGYYLTIEECFLAYKIAKEKNIKAVANSYKKQITPECYNALINWTIDIND